MKSDMEINLDPQNIDTLHVWGRFQVYVPHALMLHELNQLHHTFATLELKKTWLIKELVYLVQSTAGLQRKTNILKEICLKLGPFVHPSDI